MMWEVRSKTKLFWLQHKMHPTDKNTSNGPMATKPDKVHIENKKNNIHQTRFLNQCDQFENKKSYSLG